jgi:hypothetical protein
LIYINLQRHSYLNTIAWRFNKPILKVLIWVGIDIANKNYLDVCHDGAIFHFFIEESQRMKYLEQEVRYETEKFHGQFGKSFKPIDSSTVIHKTPMGTIQQPHYYFLGWN